MGVPEGGFHEGLRESVNGSGVSAALSAVVRIPAKSLSLFCVVGAWLFRRSFEVSGIEFSRPSSPHFSSCSFSSFPADLPCLL